MKQTDTLKSLEIVLESFLERAVKLKANRLQVIDGINRLDDITRGYLSDVADDPGMTDQIGNWLAEHNGWLGAESLRLGDRSRLSQIISGLRKGLSEADDQSPAGQKITAEIDRWHTQLASPPKLKHQPPKSSRTTGQKLVLRKGPETLDEAGLHPSSEDSIGLFTETLKNVIDQFQDMSHDRLHLMSVLDNTLQKANIGPNREALLLSAMIIYYLKQNGYMVEPFVKRLKEAERLHKGAERHA